MRRRSAARMDGSIRSCSPRFPKFSRPSAANPTQNLWTTCSHVMAAAATNGKMASRAATGTWIATRPTATTVARMEKVIALRRRRATSAGPLLQRMRMAGSAVTTRGYAPPAKRAGEGFGRADCLESMQTSIVRSVIVSAALVLAACSGAPTTTPLGSAPSQASAATTASEATVKPPPSIPTPTMQPALAGSRIVFYRDDGTFPPPAYLIGPDGTGEAVLPRDGIRPGAWSPDGTMLAGPQLSGAGGTVDEEWFRPAVMRPDGSGFLVLDAYPDRRLNLVPVGWSA